VVPISNSCLDVGIMESDIFMSLDNIKVYTCINSRIFVLNIYIIFHA
jgi:hypothetical protein